MSTRCRIELYRGHVDDKTKKMRWDAEPETTLYHHTDGYPDYMVGKLQRFLAGAYTFLQGKRVGHWEPMRVGGLFIMLSAEDADNPLVLRSTDRQDSLRSDQPLDTPRRPDEGLPLFWPFNPVPGDIDWLYRIYLGPKSGEHKIEIYRAIDHDGPMTFVRHRTPRAKVKKERKLVHADS